MPNSLPQGQGDDHGDTPATATSIATGQTIRGRIDHAQDVDVFAVSLKQNTAYWVKLEGGNYLHSWAKYLTSGLSISTAPGGSLPQGEDAAQSLYAGVDATYYLSVNRDTLLGLGDYQLTVLPYQPELGPGGVPLALEPGMILRQYQPHADGNYRLHLDAGQTVGIALGSDTTRMTVVDAAGQVLTGTSVVDLSYGGRFSYAVLQADSARDVFIRVTDPAAMDGQSRDDIQLRILALAPDSQAPQAASPTLEVSAWNAVDNAFLALGFNEAVFPTSQRGLSLLDSQGHLVTTIDALNLNPFHVDQIELLAWQKLMLAPDSNYTLRFGTGMVSDFNGNTNRAPLDFTLHTAAFAKEASAGSDWLLGGLSPRLDGGAGTDTALFTSPRSDWEVHALGKGVVEMRNVRDPALSQTLNSIERIAFVHEGDGLLTDVDGPAATLFRLYDTVLGRTPGANEVRYWYENFPNIVAGFDTRERVYSIVIHAAARELGVDLFDVDNTNYVTTLYQHALHRAPSAPELGWWVDQLEHGLSRVTALDWISESPEHQALTLVAVSAGIPYNLM